MASEETTKGPSLVKTATLTPPDMTVKGPRELLEAKAAPGPIKNPQPQPAAQVSTKTEAGPAADTGTTPSGGATPGSVETPQQISPGETNEARRPEAPPTHAVGASAAPRKIATRPLSEVKAAAATAATTKASITPASTGAAPKSTATVAPKKAASPMSSLASRVAEMLGADAGAPPAGLKGGSTNNLHTGYFHFMIYGEPNTYKTTTAAEFGGPEHTLIIVTRRSEQLIPLARKGYKFVVAEDAESLRWALLHPERAAEVAAAQANEPEWAERWKNDVDRVVIIDDITEGTNVLKEDYMYVFNEKTGETKAIKDPRQAYKKAGDELHDHLKIMLPRQHVGLIALDKNFDVEGTADNRTEPDMPNKMMKLVETELEFVFFFPHGDKMQTVTSKATRSAQLEGKKEVVMWNEIIFAKCKLPVEYLGKGVVGAKENKDLRAVWKNVQAALKGEWKPAPTQQQPPTRPASAAAKPAGAATSSTTAASRPSTSPTMASSGKTSSGTPSVPVSATRATTNAAPVAATTATKATAATATAPVKK